MKIEVAPWIRDYVTNMEELYCELTLEKINNKPYGSVGETLARYQLLFQAVSVPSKKILIKGDPGFGKTTLVKKIAWDWAKRVFTKVYAVFFLFLKRVKQDQTIENAIIEQMHELEGLHISEQKLESLMENFGRRCLLILDGLDEHALGQNHDVLKVIRHQKYFFCNIILTSRPHSTRAISQHFDTIVSVKGFTRTEAKRFASYIVPNDLKVEQILDFNPAGSKEEIVLHQCPILLSFMCILVRETELDLTSKKMSHGEIYTKMIRCLYKKFCIRKNYKFDVKKFCRAASSVGKLALETLVSGHPFFKRSRVIEQVGKDAFDYGFLIGNEDMIQHLTTDILIDILITFPHRSIQEFLGAFFFVWMIGDGVRVDSLLGKSSLLMQNQLFLHFCFWLLSDKCHNEYISCPNKDNACEALYKYICAQISGKQLNFRNITQAYPSIDMQDEIIMEHLGKILELVENVECLTIKHDQSIDWTLKYIQPFDTLTIFTVEYYSERPQNLPLTQLTFSTDCKTYLNIILPMKKNHQEERIEALDCILQNAVISDRQPAVFFYFLDSDIIKISRLFEGDIWKLYIICCKYSACIAEHEIGTCRFLTHLFIMGNGTTIIIQENLLSALGGAVRKRKLPNLRYLCLANASGVMGNVKYLFNEETKWPNLTHLSLYDCDLV